MCEVTSETLKIPDLSKTGLTDILDMPRKGKITIKPYTKVPDYSNKREEIVKNVNWKVDSLGCFVFAVQNNFFVSCEAML